MLHSETLAAFTLFVVSVTSSPLYLSAPTDQVLKRIDTSNDPHHDPISIMLNSRDSLSEDDKINGHWGAPTGDTITDDNGNTYHNDPISIMLNSRAFPDGYTISADGEWVTDSEGHTFHNDPFSIMINSRAVGEDDLPLRRRGPAPEGGHDNPIARMLNSRAFPDGYTFSADGEWVTDSEGHTFHNDPFSIMINSRAVGEDDLPLRRRGPAPEGGHDNPISRMLNSRASREDSRSPFGGVIADGPDAARRRRLGPGPIVFSGRNGTQRQGSAGSASGGTSTSTGGTVINSPSSGQSGRNGTSSSGSDV